MKDELKNIAPVLSEMKKENVFSTPKNYFDDFSERMYMKDELKNIAPGLSELKKENVFSTPKNYFADFSARMHTKIEQEKKPAVEKKPRIIQLLKPALGLAASFALIFMLVYLPIKTFMKPEINTVAQSTEVEDQDFMNLLENLDEQTFFAALEGTEAEEEFSETELVAYVNANFTDFEIFTNLEN